MNYSVTPITGRQVIEATKLTIHHLAVLITSRLNIQPLWPYIGDFSISGCRLSGYRSIHYTVVLRRADIH